MFRNKKITIATAVLILAISFFVSCLDDGKEVSNDIRGSAYAGSQACLSCHKDVYDHYLLTAHQNTSKPASQKSIIGDITSLQNAFVYSDSDKVSVDKKDGNFYQTEYTNGTKKRAERFDITIGSGRKAQTYLYYKNDQLYELPLSYFKNIGAWTNSPGFPADHPYFDRNIPSACFGCHGSAANVKLEQTGSLEMTEKYLPNQILFGIDCERCHGPATQHVNYQAAHPDDKKSHFITTIKSLTRTQQTDLCALCHSGIKKPIQPSFTFKPGDKLDDYYFPDALQHAASSLDVHDTQAQTFVASACYRKSNTLTCTSCHDPHQNERENIALFSLRCASCHTEAAHNFCTVTGVSKEAIKANCIDCHMPAKPSKVIQMLSNVDGKQSLHPDSVRTHIVAIYPEETKSVITHWKMNR